MAIFKPSTWGISKVISDVKAYRSWIHTIKGEEMNPQSRFNKWEINRNPFYTLYFTHTIEESEAQLPEKIMRLRLIESLAPLHRYLDEELGFAGYLTPEFNQFYDEEGNPTLTYLISYRFCFNKLSFRWVVWLLMKLGMLWLVIHIFLNRVGLDWIKPLIQYIIE